MFFLLLRFSKMQIVVYRPRILLSMMICGSLMYATAADSHTVSICPVESVTDWIFGFRDQNCVVSGANESPCFAGVTEGDEISLQKALNLVQKNSHEYVALLFYASWCPFSSTFRPSFSILSSFYPVIPHFAIEESSIRPSILSKYGVHGFPTLVLLNSTIRVRYHGSRALGSLVAFYSDVTGIKNAFLDEGSIGRASHHEKHDTPGQESCPFSWARSPENLLREETYLALATTFVILRLSYLTFPAMLAFAQFIWRRHVQNMRLGSLLEHPRAYLNRAVQLFNSLKEPCKRSNLQEGALNARAWASKSLATVSECR
ncbi:5'-ADENYLYLSULFATE REDUCTASE-LIKE 4-RELATED [Salix koriyanagi]|uniref:5'-ADENYLYLSULFATE REDUCTASE-LIKE 4-RELATED n=1 Tax=Salix koriyanagi TaxID=2511006 RepID=A0A9Q0TDA0_9ROSI|nr:5'-ADENYLYLSULFATE REDUCTASE-LIKE 4-RELATED [Salix koriyanagi]